jgi:3-oxoacyl-[acyl-carrier protein] reductase
MPRTERRVALVTGSSRGLGSTIGRRLARDGLAVAINTAHDESGARAVADAVRDEGGVADAFSADVTDEAAVERLVSAIDRRLGPVAVLVVNATGPQPEAPLADVAWPEHVAQLEFFVKSPVLLLRAVLPGMEAERFGRIVQIDSEVVDRPPPGRSAFVTRRARRSASSAPGRVSWRPSVSP